MCLHYRTFAPIFLGFRWHPPAQYLEEALALAAADAVPMAFRRVVLTVTGIDPGTGRAPSEADPRDSSTADEAEA